MQPELAVIDLYVVDSRLTRIAIRCFLRAHGVENFELSTTAVDNRGIPMFVQVKMCARAVMKLQLQYGTDLTESVTVYRRQNRESLYRETIAEIDAQSMRRTS